MIAKNPRSPYNLKVESPARMGVCFYCQKKTSWSRLRHGIEVPVCFDCLGTYAFELRSKKEKDDDR
jgi:hypothetical protein